MITADIIALIVGVVSLGFGALLGFGRSLKVFTKGIFGFVVSLVVCYFIYGIVLDWKVVGDLLEKFHNFLVKKNNFFCDLLITIRIDMIAFYAGLFIIVTLIRVFLVNLICELMSSENKAVRVVNKILGAIFFTFMVCVVALIVFQILSGSSSFGAKLEGSFFKLDKIFKNNPLKSIIEGFKK